MSEAAIRKSAQEALESLGSELKKKLDQYVGDRAHLEQQWLRNLRQYRGIYDPETLALIPPNKSRAYPKDTRVKVKGFVAKLMELMFPAMDINWELEVTPFPSIPEDAINQVIAALEMENYLLEQQGQEAIPIDDARIEEAVLQEAKKRKERMTKRILDQMLDSDCDWPSVCKRVIRSGAIYGLGVVRSPVVRTQKERRWVREGESFKAVTRNEKRPFSEFIKVFDIYPDLSAATWQEQEGLFERMVFTRKTLSDLKKRPNFKKETIDKYLQDHKEGNYTVRPFEEGLNQMNNTSISAASRAARRFEVYRWYGFVSAHDLAACGVEIKQEDMGSSVLADVWLLDNNILFADLAPFGQRVSDVYHAYVYAEDEEASLAGCGMPEELRDRQASICVSTRALYDNVAATAGPIYEVAVDLLKRRNQAPVLHAFTVIEREGEDATLQYPAIRAVQTDSHIPELSSLLDKERQQFDIESNLPSWTMGNAQPLGEAFRTSSNMSQMQGGATMITKDHTRAFDRLTASVVNSYLQWNMEFSDDDEAKGDYQVKAKGSISLVAKEVRGAALDQFISTLDEEDRALMRRRPTLIERMKARDLPTDLIVEGDEADQILKQMREQRAQQAQIEQGLTQARTGKFQAEAEKANFSTERGKEMFDAEVAEAIARITKLMAEAQASEDKAQLDLMERMMSALSQNGGRANVAQ